MNFICETVFPRNTNTTENGSEFIFSHFITLERTCTCAGHLLLPLPVHSPLLHGALLHGPLSYCCAFKLPVGWMGPMEKSHRTWVERRGRPGLSFPQGYLRLTVALDQRPASQGLISELCTAWLSPQGPSILSLSVWTPWQPLWTLVFPSTHSHFNLYSS